MPPSTNDQNPTEIAPPTTPPALNPPQPQPKSRKRRIIGGALGTLLLIAAALAIINAQKISDWWQLHDYQPPANVQQLADQTTMTPYARHMFYLNNPGVIASVSSFRDHCPENKETIVLGCYHPGENGIYIYQVKDPELQGVSQVTAAHETLHAIYARLSPSERDRVNKMLLDYYNHDLKDPNVKAEIDLYKKTEPNDVLDEMHSVFGTEVDNLPPALGGYYKQYFSDRSKIVAYEKQYEQAFATRQAKIKQYDQQLSTIKKQIDSQEASLQSQQSQLNSTQSQLKSLLASGQTDAYNSQIPAYNAQVNTYNDAVASLRQQINQYNALVDTRNTVAGELTTLDKAVDTRQLPNQTKTRTTN